MTFFPTDLAQHSDRSEVISLVSIVIPSYNHGLYIQETIQSVIDQDYLNIELIIIDDGSADDSVLKIQEMVAACELRFIRFEFRHRANIGLCATLNEALVWSKGVYFAPIASDDILKSYKTSTQTRYLNTNRTCAGVFGAVEIISPNAQIQQRDYLYLLRKRKYYFADIFLHKHNLPAPSQFLRIESIRCVGGYRENLIIEDWSMWLFLSRAGFSLDYLNNTFSYYRRHKHNASANLIRMKMGKIEIVNLFSKHHLYTRALAAVYLIDALDWQYLDFKRSLVSIKKSFSIDRRIIFSRNFAKFIFRFFSLNYFNKREKN